MLFIVVWPTYTTDIDVIIFFFFLKKRNYLVWLKGMFDMLVYKDLHRNIYLDSVG